MEERETKNVNSLWSHLTPSTKGPIKYSGWDVREVFKMEMVDLQIKWEVSACIGLNCCVQHRESNLPALFVHLVMNVLTDWNAAKCYFMLSLLLGVLWGLEGQRETEQCTVKSSGSQVKHNQVGVQVLSLAWPWANYLASLHLFLHLKRRNDNNNIDFVSYGKDCLRKCMLST